MRKIAMHALRIAALTVGLTLISCLPLASPQAREDAAERINPPFNISLIRAETGRPDQGNFQCPPPPPALHDLQMESIYGNLSENNSVIDPDSYDAYIRETGPISQYQKKLGTLANRYVLSNPARPEIAVCVLAWLNAWAEEDALMGDTNRTGEFVRKWALSPIALAYLQIRDEPSLKKKEKRAVEKWIRRIAETVISDFSRDTHLSSRQNNHLYWAAWSVAVSGAALNDSSLFKWGMEKARFGISQIDQKGILPLELARGRMALNYHIFAAMPLVMLAELGQRNRVNLYAENNGGIKRLAKRTLGGIEDPSYFVKATGEKQDLSHALDSSSLAWLEPYNTRYPSDAGAMWLSRLRPMSSSRMGGNVTLLFGR